MRISDWSSDVCSSDLPSEKGLDRSSGSSSRVLTGIVALLASSLGVVLRDSSPPQISRSAMPARSSAVPIASDDRTEQQARSIPSDGVASRTEEHTSELQSLMLISSDVFCCKKKT